LVTQSAAAFPDDADGRNNFVTHGPMLGLGDNGADDYFVTAEHRRGVHSGNKHHGTGLEYRGKKRTLYEGGLRVPFLAYWPGRVAPGGVTDQLGYLPDVLPPPYPISDRASFAIR
jgi:hypothetical protein